jgi:hypothetical protein
MDDADQGDAVSDKPAANREEHSIDRRSPNDRRSAHDLSYFEDGGPERRRNRKRRERLLEMRKGWVRVTDWTSAVVGVFKRTYDIED